MGMTSAVSVPPVPSSGRGSGSRRLEAPAMTDPAANAIQASDTAKNEIMSPCRKVMLAKRTTCSIWYTP